MYFLYVGGHVFVVEWLHVDIPLMRVPILFTFFTKRTSHITVHNWLHYGEALNKISKVIADLCGNSKNVCYTFTRPPESGPKSVGIFKLFIILVGVKATKTDNAMLLLFTILRQE